MRVGFACLAKSAEAGEFGVSMLSAGFEGITVPADRFKAGPITFVTKLYFQPDEIGEHPFRLFVSGNEDFSIPEISGTVAVESNEAHPGDSSPAVLAIPFGVKFKQPGRCAVSLEVDGKLAVSIPFAVYSSIEK